MNKYILTFVIFYIFLSSCCTVKTTEAIRDLKSYSINDSLNTKLIDTTAFIKIGHCEAINLHDYKFNTISELRNGDFPYHCIINYAEKQDTLAQRVLYEICNMVGDNVYRFDYENSSEIQTFLKETLFLTPKNNKWVGVLLKYAKDNNCQYFKHEHYPSNEHFGLWVTGIIISNLSNKEYAKELSRFKKELYNIENERSGNILSECEIYKIVHLSFMARLEQDYKDGKLNFEPENK